MNRMLKTVGRIALAMALGLVLLYVSIPMAKAADIPEIALALTAGGVALYFAAVSHATRFIGFPYADLKKLIFRAQENPVGAGLAALGVMLVMASLILASAMVYAGELPTNAQRHLPLLKQEQASLWPDMPIPSVLAGQVEQETCPSLKSPMCWNPRAEFRTSREYGFGLGQLTVTARFNAFEEARHLDRALADWKWKDRYDPRHQLRALVLKDKAGHRMFYFAADVERLAMMLAGYNGGNSGVLQDRKLCQLAPGCEPNKWFGHVERHSRKAKMPAKGYGRSFFAINREYVHNAIYVRRGKYASAMGDKTT